MSVRLAILAAVALLQTACEQHLFFEEKKEIPNGVWTYRDTLNFSFTVSDTSQLYNMYADFEHADTFPNQNIYLRLHTRFPDGQRLSKVRSFDLFDEKGESKGKCSGQRCRVRSLLQDNAYFNMAGEYVITLEQFMRSDSLPGVRAVGLYIEKTKLRRE
ncbi:MAG: gliding motility lipoprotein GldH [Saprospiraceae bacterium]|nr:gliding motility lipoprotein GldH [Saprospiraceae bacterium]